MPKKALVTGAAGFIGKHVTGLLLAEGWEVSGLDVLPQPAGLECGWHQASILDSDALNTAMKGCDTVFHLAARAHLFAKDVNIFETINHQGTRAVISAALGQSVEHLVATLSATALTPAGFKGTVSPMHTRPALSDLAGPYARSKWRADQALGSVQSGSLSITRLFPTVPIGVGDDAFTAPTEMIRMFLTTPPPAILETALNLVCVKDVAKAHVRAAQLQLPSADNARRQYILAGERWLLSDLLAKLETLTQGSMPKRTIPYPLARVAASVSETLARLRNSQSLATVEGVKLAAADPHYDIDASRQDLEWEPRPVAPALEETVHWLMQQTPIVSS